MKFLNNRFIKILICCGLINSGLMAEEKDWPAQLIEKGLVFFKIAEVDEQPYVLTVYQHQTQDHLSITHEGKKLYSTSQGSVTSGFKNIQTFARTNQQDEKEVLAIIRWQKGAHGETLEVINLSQSKVLLRKNSSWPVEYQIKDDEVHYKIFGDRQEDGSFAEQTGKI